MSYVVEFAKSVHAAFRAPNNFCHDLQHVMRGAVKNFNQSCLLTEEPEQLARYQVIYNSLQSIIETNTTMSECTAEQSDTFTMMESTADHLAGSTTSDTLAGQRRPNMSASSYRSSDSAREQTFESFDQIGAENLRAVLTPEMLTQLTDIYNAAVVVEKKEAELRALEPKLAKYAKHKKTAKLQEAESVEKALKLELAEHKGALQDGMTACFPEVYKRILREYIDLCNSLLRATQVGTDILERGAAAAAAVAAANRNANSSNNNNNHNNTDGADAGNASPCISASHRDGSVALTVDALEAHEALEEVKEEMKHRRDGATSPEQKLHDRIEFLIAPTAAAAAAGLASGPAGSAKPASAASPRASEAPTAAAVAAASMTSALPLQSPNASTVAPPAPTPHSIDGTSRKAHSPPGATEDNEKAEPAATVPPTAHSSSRSNDTELLSLVSVHVASPHDGDETRAASGATPAASPANLHEESVDAAMAPQDATTPTAPSAPVLAPAQPTPSEHATESVAPSLAGAVHARFPFWFRYYYFDRLANSTERLAIAFGLYVSYCKRLARKAGYTIPLPVKKHMDRIEMEFTTARYARHKREFEAVLKGIFTYRKNLEVMETYARLAREAEAHVNKHAGGKDKKAYAKWNAKLTKINESIEQLRVEVFERGADDMVQFYDQLLQCIRVSLSDFIVTLGGSPS